MGIALIKGSYLNKTWSTAISLKPYPTHFERMKWEIMDECSLKG